MKPSIVEVTVSGGVVQHVQCPPGVRVIVRDYDVEGADEQEFDIRRDQHGEPYEQFEFGEEDNETDKDQATEDHAGGEPEMTESNSKDDSGAGGGIQLTDQQLAHVLAALRYCQNPKHDLSAMPHFDEAGPPLSKAEVDELCESLNSDTQPANAYTVVGLLPDTDWDGEMRDASVVEQVTADTPAAAAKAARLLIATNRVESLGVTDDGEKAQEIEQFAQSIDILAVFNGRLIDQYDSSVDK